MSLVKNLKGIIVEIAAGKIGEKIDGREFTRKLDAAIDSQLGEKSSEKVQRGALWKFIKELAEGLYEENPEDLRLELAKWIRELK